MFTRVANVPSTEFDSQYEEKRVTKAIATPNISFDQEPTHVRDKRHHILFEEPRVTAVMRYIKEVIQRI